MASKTPSGCGTRNVPPTQHQAATSCSPPGKAPRPGTRQKAKREITTPRLSGAREAAQWTAEFIIHPAARPETTGRHSGKKRTVHFQSVKITSTSPPAREGEKEKKGTERLSDKCLEATQLKTVRTVVAILRFEPGGVEVQEADIGAGHRRRPTVPAVADAPQRAVECMAVARGRAALSISGGNATEDRMHGNCCSAERASRSRSANSRYRCPPSS